MKRKNTFIVYIILSMIFFSCAKNSDVVDLSFISNISFDHPNTIALEFMITKFEEQNPNITVTLLPSSGSTENMIGTRIAANDIPDLWTTHGWSVIRYSEYLRPLNDQPWFPLIDPQIKPVISNEQGEVFVLPMNRDVAGIVYSQTIFDEIGIDASTIKTWDDLLGAMQQIKDYGITPVHMGGKDPYAIGNFFDWVAPAFFVTDENNNDKEQLASGNFNTEKWTELAQLLKSLQDRGFLNKDVLSSTFNDSAEALATKDAAIVFYGNHVISTAQSLNLDIEYGFFPAPAYYEGDTPTLISGERMAVGINRETPYEEQALQFLNYLAQPANIKEISEADVTPTGLTNATADLGKLTQYFEMYKDVRVFPFFDRAYLPAGMWNTMCTTGAALLAGTMTSEEVAQEMKKVFSMQYKK